MIEARASRGGVFAIGALILDTGHLILDKLNNFKRMIQHPASSNQHLNVLPIRQKFGLPWRSVIE